MDWQNSKDLILGFLASGVVIYFGRTLNILTESVQELNIRVAALLEQKNDHEDRIRKLEQRRQRRKDSE